MIRQREKNATKANYCELCLFQSLIKIWRMPKLCRFVITEVIFGFQKMNEYKEEKMLKKYFLLFDGIKKNTKEN